MRNKLVLPTTGLRGQPSLPRAHVLESRKSANVRVRLPVEAQKCPSERAEADAVEYAERVQAGLSQARRSSLLVAPAVSHTFRRRKTPGWRPEPPLDSQATQQ